MCGGAKNVTRNVLPADPKPSHYDLRIEPNLKEFTFAGDVVIALTAKNPVSTLVFNYAELTFDKADVTCGSFFQAFSSSTDFALDEKNMRASLSLSQPLVGDIKLHIAYRGIINDKMHGFYRSKFTLRGEDAFLATTQFEAVDARRALPCWDEPTHKATFDVTLVVPRGLLALSNTAEVARYPVDGDDSLVRVVFGRTPIMSTYLLAWTIGEMDVIERRIPKTRGGETTVRIFATAGKISQGAFALDVACQVLPLYEEFFGSDYVLSKCDLLAIPDFAAGAMENWGLITYRESALLCDDSSSAVHRQWVALVVAHELAHQWFGNLVTMDWWKELWLNEAFATWVEYWAVDTLFPSWSIFTQFVHDETGRALQLDALRSSHPVEVDVVNAQEIDEIFDAISYCKGGSILRMAIEFIGLDAFRTGIRNYLKHFQFRNANTVDLWNFLGKAAGKDLAPILELWTGKQGYPYLVVDRAGDQVTVTQHRFLSTGDATEAEDETVWRVPLLYLHEGAASERPTPIVLESRSNAITIPAEASWIKINAKQAAFCRVQYSSSVLDSVVQAVVSQKVSNVDRLSLVSDYHAFAQGGFISTVDLLRLLKGYREEGDSTVWGAIVTAEADIRNIVYNEGVDAMNRLGELFRTQLYLPAIQRIGFLPREGDDHRTAQLRGSLFARLTSLGDPESIATAKQLFANREKSPIPADLRAAVYSTIVREGGAAEVEQFKALAEAATDAMDRARYLRALGASKQPEVLKSVMEYGLTDKVRAQDCLYIYGAISGNPKSHRLYAEGLMTHWRTFNARLPGMLLGRIIKFVESSADSKLADELEAFWPTVDEEMRMAMDRSFRQGIEGIRNNAKWAARDAAAVNAFLTAGTQ